LVGFAFFLGHVGVEGAGEEQSGEYPMEFHDGNLSPDRRIVERTCSKHVSVVAR
jgi:hypothetical protein